MVERPAGVDSTADNAQPRGEAARLRHAIANHARTNTLSLVLSCPLAVSVTSICRVAVRQQIEARACEHRSVWPTRRASSFHPHGGANVSDCFLPISPVYLAASASAALTPSAANAASTTAMGFTLYNLLKAVLLLTNALAILHPHRFLAAHGLDGAGLADGGGGVKQQVAGLLHATRFMRCACCLRARAVRC